MHHYRRGPPPEARTYLKPRVAAKKYLTGSAHAEKSMILLKVFQRYGLEAADDNVADAINLNMIGRNLLCWIASTTEPQRAVMAELCKAPKVKVIKTSKKPKAA